MIGEELDYYIVPETSWAHDLEKPTIYAQPNEVKTFLQRFKSVGAFTKDELQLLQFHDNGKFYKLDITIAPTLAEDRHLRKLDKKLEAIKAKHRR